MGPGTHLKKRLKRGDPGINRLDKIAKQHDMDYSQAKNLQDKWKADAKMVKAISSRSSSAIHEYCCLEGHLVDPNKTKVLSTEVNTFKRRRKEAIQIKLTKPALNRDNGYELAAIYDTILTPKRR